MYLTQGCTVRSSTSRTASRPSSATVSAPGPTTLSASRSECAERVARLAAALVNLGVEQCDRVAVLSLNSDRYYEAFLAVPWAGAVINPIDASAVAHAVEKHRITDVLLVLTMVQSAVRPGRQRGRPLDPASAHLRRVPISEAVLDRRRDRPARRRFTQLYGMTELSPVATLLDDGVH